MNKKDAIKYLQRKKILRRAKVIKPRFNEKEKKEIDKVMKEGKIYGDPLVEVDL